MLRCFRRRPSANALLVQELKLVLEKQSVRAMKEKAVLQTALTAAEERSTRLQDALDVQNQTVVVLRDALADSREKGIALLQQNQVLLHEKREMEASVSDMSHQNKLLQEQRDGELKHLETVTASYAEVQQEKQELLTRLELLDQQGKDKLLCKTAEVDQLKAELSRKDLVQHELNKEQKKNKTLHKKLLKAKNDLLQVHRDVALLAKDAETELEKIRRNQNVCSSKKGCVPENEPSQWRWGGLFKNRTSKDLNEATASGEEPPGNVEALIRKLKGFQEAARKLEEGAQNGSVVFAEHVEVSYVAMENYEEEREQLQRVILEKDKAFRDLEEEMKEMKEMKEREEALRKDLEKKLRDAEISMEQLNKRWLLKTNQDSASIAELRRELSDCRSSQEKSEQELEERARGMRADALRIKQLEDKVKEMEQNPTRQEHAETVRKLELRLKKEEKRRQEQIRSLKRVNQGLEANLRAAQMRSTHNRWRRVLLRET